MFVVVPPDDVRPDGLLVDVLFARLVDVFRLAEFLVVAFFFAAVFFDVLDSAVDFSVGFAVTGAIDSGGSVDTVVPDGSLPRVGLGVADDGDSPGDGAA